MKIWMMHAACWNKSKTRALWRGQNHLNTHFTAVPFFRHYLWTSPKHSHWHKQPACQQTNKQASKPRTHTPAVLIRGQTWLNEHVALSLQHCHLGKQAKTNWTPGYGTGVVYSIQDKTAYCHAHTQQTGSHQECGRVWCRSMTPWVPSEEWRLWREPTCQQLSEMSVLLVTRSQRERQRTACLH